MRVFPVRFGTPLPTNMRLVSNILSRESSIQRLPESLQLSALKILEIIHRYKLKRIPLNVRPLRKEVRMDSHRFHALFEWLKRHGYCTSSSTKTIISKVTRSRWTGRFWVTLVDITVAGELVLGKCRRLGRLKEIARDICRFSPSKDETDSLRPHPTSEMDLVPDLIVEAFDLAYAEFYYAGKKDEYQRFRRGLEERLREHLDKEVNEYLAVKLSEHLKQKVEDRHSIVHDVYFIVTEIPSEVLLKDAKLAMENGHFLTQNHRYVLRKMEKMEEKGLIDHNIQWRNRFMGMTFSGNEPFQEFQRLTDPREVVERERKERSTPHIPEPQVITFPRDCYDFNENWNPGVARLQYRWDQARKCKHPLLRATTDDEWRERLHWIRENQPWRIRDSAGTPLILYEDIS